MERYTKTQTLSIHMVQNAEHEVLLRILSGDATFIEKEVGEYETHVQVDTAATAEKKLNRYARLIDQGTTPLFRFRGQDAPITHISAEENVLTLRLKIDPLTLLPRKK